MSVSTMEQETVINYGRNDEWASVYTSDSTVMTKLDKFANDADNPDWNLESEQTLEGKVVSKTYTCKKRLISFRSKKVQREMTEEQKLAQGERLRAAMEKKRL